MSGTRRLYYYAKESGKPEYTQDNPKNMIIRVETAESYDIR